MTPHQRKIRFPIHFFMTLILCVGLIGACSSKPKPPQEKVGNIDTETIVFVCDEQVNQGLLLPVDVIYVTRYRMLREITAVGPDRWFDSVERAGWEEKQTIGLKGGETKKLKLKRLWRDNSKVLVVYANFKGINGPHPQQVIIDHTADSEEKIRVFPAALVTER